MPNQSFQFKEFKINQDKTSMKVGTDGIIFGSWINIEEAKYILDIGTGTGIIALMLAQKSLFSIIDAVEIDQSASEQAARNVNESRWKERIKIHQISFQDYISQNEKKYDLVVSNPPYFKSAFLSKVKLRNQSRHQINLTFSELVTGVDKLLDPNGRLCIIIPYDLRTYVINECKNNGLYPYHFLKIKPTPYKMYHRIILEFIREKRETDGSEITIYDDQAMYTTEFKNLTRDYYLKFED